MKVSPASLDRFIRYVLGALLLIITLNAIGGGIYGIMGAPGVPVEWLSGSPLRSYLLPGVVLLVVVGGSALYATIMIFGRHRLAMKATYFAGSMMIAWIGVQVAIIGYVSWLQPIVGAAGILIVVLNRVRQRVSK